MSHRFKAPKKMGVMPTRRGDPIKLMLMRIARLIPDDAELQRASMKVPAYARDQWLREIQPYLSFKPATFIPPQPAEEVPTA